MKYYVYSKYMESGTENFVGVYDDYKSAIEKIKSLYAIDDKSCMKNMFYYFMKQRLYRNKNLKTIDFLNNM